MQCLGCGGASKARQDIEKVVGGSSHIKYLHLDCCQGRKSRVLGGDEATTQSLLRKVKEESEKVVLKLNIQKTKIMASGPITSWQIDGETVETVADFIFLGSKITADVTAAMKLKDAYSLKGKL